MVDQPINQIEHKDLLALIENKIPESRSIEYKSALNVGSDGEKHKFLAAITSFANTDGGDLLYGMQEEAGIPVAIPTIGEPNEDELRQKLESLCRQGIDPRLPSVEFHFIAVDGQKVLVIRVPKSWRAPHRVTLGGSGNFYGRNSAGKFPMDVNELRTAFTNSESLINRVAQYRQQRVTAIFNHDTPIGIQFGCAMIFHIVPLSALTGNGAINLAKQQNELTQFYPLGRNNHQNSKVSLRGHTNYANLTNERSHAYTLVTPRAEVEAVAVFTEVDGHKIVHSKTYEEYLLGATNRYFALLGKMGIEPPFYLLLTFAGISGYSLLAPYDNGIGYQLHECTEPYAVVHLPEIYLTEIGRPEHEMLRPLFDMVWNLFGMHGSQNYTTDGLWQK